MSERIHCVAALVRRLEDAGSLRLKYSLPLNEMQPSRGSETTYGKIGKRLVSWKEIKRA
jgi:hypothetical protein